VTQRRTWKGSKTNNKFNA